MMAPEHVESVHGAEHQELPSVAARRWLTSENHAAATTGECEMLADVTTLTVTEAAEARRSIRKYTDRAVPAEDMREILRITGLAPSAFNVQPWRFVVVEDEAAKAALQQAAYGQKQVGGAPAVVVVYSDMKDALEKVEETVHPGYPEEQRPAAAEGVLKAFAGKTEEELRAWGAGQSYIALGYLMLAAQSLGYATSPMLGFDPAKVRELLGLPEHVAIPAIVALGEADEAGFPHHRHPVERVASFR
jgi:nitroreductase